MPNPPPLRDILQYHERTKHSLESVRASRHHLDWEIQPLPFKVYPDLKPLPLPRTFAHSSVPALEAIAGTGPAHGECVVPDLQTLARLLYFSCGIVRTKTYPGGQRMHFRAAACTGALYHVDAYLVCADVPGLPAGVYHFGPHDFSLYRLRPGDHRGVLVEATAAEPSIAAAPAVLVFTSTFWRNAWKYQDRAYRHCFWDNGTILANLFAAGASCGVPLRLVTGFVDDEVNRLLDLDTSREVALSLVAIGNDPSASPPAAPAVGALGLRVAPLSSREVDYPLIRLAHDASSLRSAEEVRAWRASYSGGAIENAAPRGRLGHEPAGGTSEPVEAVILRRGSARRFSHAPISSDQLRTVLACACRPVSADFGARGESPAPGVDVYALVSAVDGLEPGTYALRDDSGELAQLRAGDFRRQAGFLGLGQELPADAAVNIYTLADLRSVVARHGSRGYRVAQIEGAIVGGKIYLAAYALGLGATGLTFFDDDVVDFFSPDAAGKSVLFLAAVGRPGRR